jgi:hypothetical protein
MLQYGALSSHRQTNPQKYTMPVFSPKLIHSTATVRGWWLPRWVASQPIAQVSQTLAGLLLMLAEGKLSTPATKRYPMSQFQDAVHLADGESGQQYILLDVLGLSRERPPITLGAAASSSRACKGGLYSSYKFVRFDITPSYRSSLRVGNRFDIRTGHYVTNVLLISTDSVM